jgi:hypothetical protein
VSVKKVGQNRAGKTTPSVFANSLAVGRSGMDLDKKGENLKQIGTEVHSFLMLRLKFTKKCAWE